ncbi:hypothetical protein LCGC14_2965850 [marine sediment metagenome]|uniref:Uncharacterized protein n=1 Tax=marine sediment metagenome TaxID=412755 RepID=A0A0F8ZIL3_9ZZZZ
MAAKTKGTFENPLFVTSGEQELHLKPVPGLLLDRYMLEWTHKNPMPRPPVREANIGGQVVAIQDDNNAYFQEEKEMWDSAHQHARLSFILAYGIIEKTPIKWEGHDDFPEGNRIEQRAAWIESLLVEGDDISGLAEAIASLSEPTAKGVEEAEKN